MNTPLLSLIRQLKQRKLVQWTLAYLAGAWLVLQVVDVLKDQFLWGLAFQRSVTAVLIVGFFAALVFAWYHGEEGRQNASTLELLILTTLLVLAGAAVAFVRKTTPPAPPSTSQAALAATAVPLPDERASIAVLPFANLSDDASLDYFSDGFTEELINRLANVEGLRVASRSASFALRKASNPVEEVARKLAVSAVLEGSIRRADDNVRVTAQLINAADGFHIWSKTYERKVQGAGLFGLEDELTREISSALNLRLQSDAKARGGAAGPEAYDAYLRGLFYFRQDPISDSALHYFRRAVALEPDFADAHGALARVYDERNFEFGRDSAEFRELAFVEIENALRLDPNLAEAYVSRASLNWTLENGFPHVAVASDFKRAVELNPNLSDAHEQLGALYGHVGLNEKAIAHARATLRLNPYDRSAYYHLSRALLFQGRYQEALDELNKQPTSDTDYHKPIVLWRLGKGAEAERLVRQQLAGVGTAALRNTRRYDYESVYAMLLANRGKAAEAQQQIAYAIRDGDGLSHFHHSAYHIACAYALLNRRADAMRWLARTAREGFPNYPLFARDPALDNLRNDSAFKAFLAEQKKLFEYHQRVL